MEISINLAARSVGRKLMTIVISLVMLSLISRPAVFYWKDVPGVEFLAHQFYLDTEANIPSLYSAGAIAMAAGLLYLISRFEQLKDAAHARSWKILAGIFLYLSIDELNSFHEVLIVPLRRRFGLTGIFHFAWVLPAMVLLMLFVAGFLKFLWQLNRITRLQFIAAGAVFVMGAIGFEMLAGPVYEHLVKMEEFDLYSSLLYQALMTTEESLEMMGIVGFIYALLRYLNQHHGVRSLILYFPIQLQPTRSSNNTGIAQADAVFGQTELDRVGAAE